MVGANGTTPKDRGWLGAASFRVLDGANLVILVDALRLSCLLGYIYPTNQVPRTVGRIYPKGTRPRVSAAKLPRHDRSGASLHTAWRRLSQNR